MCRCKAVSWGVGVAAFRPLVRLLPEMTFNAFGVECAKLPI